MRAALAAAGFVGMLAQAGCCCFIPIDNFQKFQCRAKQSEAKGNLKALYVAEESYRAEFSTYASFADVKFAPSGEKLRYGYELASFDADHFTARAVGVDEMVGDEWAINETGQVQNVASVCGPVSAPPPPDSPKDRIQQASLRW